MPPSIDTYIWDAVFADAARCRIDVAAATTFCNSYIQVTDTLTGAPLCFYMPTSITQAPRLHARGMTMFSPHGDWAMPGTAVHGIDWTTDGFPSHMGGRALALKKQHDFLCALHAYIQDVLLERMFAIFIETPRALLDRDHCASLERAAILRCPGATADPEFRSRYGKESPVPYDFASHADFHLALKTAFKKSVELRFVFVREDDTQKFTLADLNTVASSTQMPQIMIAPRTPAFSGQERVPSVRVPRENPYTSNAWVKLSDQTALQIVATGLHYQPPRIWDTTNETTSGNAVTTQAEMEAHLSRTIVQPGSSVNIGVHFKISSQRQRPLCIKIELDQFLGVVLHAAGTGEEGMADDTPEAGEFGA